jgi:formate hydrogenlyase subunit 6/NADH:ubiquinone oxidoreductase subunit I
MSVFGMSRTIMRNLFSGPATRLYPTREKEPHRAARSRACAKRCPTDAIIVSKTDKEWNIDRLRCCTCNACVEVCPKKCLAMGNRYTPPTVTKDKDIFRQPPRPPKEPETIPGA